MCSAICIIQSYKSGKKWRWTHKLKKITKYSESYIYKISKVLQDICFGEYENYETIMDAVKMPDLIHNIIQIMEL